MKNRENCKLFSISKCLQFVIFQLLVSNKVVKSLFSENFSNQEDFEFCLLCFIDKLVLTFRFTEWLKIFQYTFTVDLFLCVMFGCF